MDLKYDEELFTSYNVLYFIKLMLQKIDGKLKKEIIKQKDIDKIIIKKKYTIWY